MRRSTRTILLLGMAVPFGDSLLARAEEEPIVKTENEQEARIRFIPRSDEQAAVDMEKLRYALSQSIDSRGPIDPLADYAKQPAAPASNKKSKSSDADAKQTPQLKREQGGEYRSPRIAWESSVDLSRLLSQPESTP